MYKYIKINFTIHIVDDLYTQALCECLKYIHAFLKTR